MTAAMVKITENDVVRLKRSFEGWPAGTQGTVVSDHDISKLIEISDSHGYELDMLEVAEENLELVKQHPSEIHGR